MTDHKPFTDPNWRPDRGGLPVHDTWRWLPPCGPGSVGTITPPPPPEPTQHERLLAFAREALHRFWEGPEGMQELGIKHGLLIETAYDPEIHGPNDVDAEPGDPWFVFADWLRTPVTIMPDSAPFAEPLPPYARMKIEAAMRAMEEAVAELRRLREGQP